MNLDLYYSLMNYAFHCFIDKETEHRIKDIAHACTDKSVLEVGFKPRQVSPNVLPTVQHHLLAETRSARWW